MTLQEIQYKAQAIMQKWRDEDSAPYIEFVEELALMTVPEEPDKSLEEAAEEAATGLNLGSYFRFIWGFKAGAEWKEQQMLKDAVEGYVNYYEDSGGILMAEAQVGCPYHNGQKVRIVVLKEEE